MSADKETIKATYQFIQQYISRRQDIVVEAMIQFRPNLIIALDLEDHFKLDDLEARIKYYEVNYKDNSEHFTGIWNGEWQYQLHGIGCEMLNIITGEYFDWDMSDPAIFSSYELFRYMRWCWYEKKARDEITKTIIDWMKDISLSRLNTLLKILETSGKISSKSDEEWYCANSD